MLCPVLRFPVVRIFQLTPGIFRPASIKVFSGWGRAREGEGQFLPKNAPPPLASLSLSPVQTGQALIVMPGGTTAKTSLQLVELVHGFASVGDIMHQDLALL